MFFLKIELYIYLIMAFINIYKLIGARSFPSFCRGDPLLLRSMPGGEGGVVIIILKNLGGWEGWRPWLC